MKAPNAEMCRTGYEHNRKRGALSPVSARATCYAVFGFPHQGSRRVVHAVLYIRFGNVNEMTDKARLLLHEVI